jgi:hypothetical protein
MFVTSWVAVVQFAAIFSLLADGCKRVPGSVADCAHRVHVAPNQSEHVNGRRIIRWNDRPRRFSDPLTGTQ